MYLYLFFIVPPVFFIGAKILKKIKPLEQLVRYQHPNSNGIIHIIILGQLLFKLGLKLYCKHRDKFEIKKIEKNIYELHFQINEIDYVLVTKLKKGPRDIETIHDENDKDITSLIKPYLGPQENFQAFGLDPRYFGKKSISINLVSGEELLFGEHDRLFL